MLLNDLKAWVRQSTALPVYFEDKPETPDALVCLREYGGEQVRGLTTHDRSVQVLFRAPAQHAHDAAWAVYRSLLPEPPVLVNAEGGKLIVRPKQSPFFLTRDAKGRSTYVFNVAVIAAPDS